VRRRLLTTVLIGILAALPAAQRRRPADLVERTIEVDGLDRRYVMHVPATQPTAPRPVVLAFHGGASNPDGMVRLTGLNDLADREDFVAVYPAGTGRFRALLTWNAGACCGYAKRQGIDDVAFVEAVIADVRQATTIDPRRIYATGMSNGAMLAYRLAAELPGTLAAIAPVAGSLEVGVPADASPTPVIHFHGTDDTHVPIDGGVGPDSLVGVPFQSVADSVGTWVRTNGCRPDPVVTTLPDLADDGMRVERRDYRGCQAAVSLVVVGGGGHTWPGTPRLERLLGPATRDIDASRMMWRFFSRHGGEGS